MNKDTLKNLALILLLGIAAFSMFRYVSELKTRFMLQDSLVLARDEVAALTQEKQNLLQELEKEKTLNQQLAANNLNLKVYLRASKGRMTRLFRENLEVQSEFEEIGSKFAVLKAENRALIDIHKRIYFENEQFRSKLSSVIELKKVIRELKDRHAATLDLDIEGNRGFLIRDGRSTLEKVKIEVIPSSYQPLQGYRAPEKNKE